MIDKNRAVSLIEILLVMLIIGAIVSGGLFFATQYAQEVKVERTAAQLKQILEAGIAYHVDKHYWPGVSEDFAPYLKVDDLKNPWGGDYSYAASDVKFQVSTTLPNVSLVSRVVNLLPNAYGNEDRVFAEIALQSLKPKLFINTIGELSFSASDFDRFGHGSKSVKITRCPLGTKQEVIITPRNIEFGTLFFTLHTPFPYHIGAVTPINCIRKPDDPDGICEAEIAVDFSALGCRDGRWAELEGGSYDCNDTGGTELMRLTGPLYFNSSMLLKKGDGKFEIYYISYCKPEL